LRADPAAIPRTEALLLRTILDHPWLLDNNLEEIAAIGLTSPAARELRARMVTLCLEHGGLDAEALHRELRHGSAAGALDHIGSAMAIGQGMSRENVMDLWRHRLAMHRRAVELPRELEAAGQAFGADASATNLLRMQNLLLQIHQAGQGA
jgi:DNA primase